MMTNKRARRAALLAVLWIPAIAVLIAVREVLLPFLLALLFAYLLAPSVRWLSSKRIGGRAVPPWAAVVTLYLACGAGVAAVGSVVVPQLYREVARLAEEGTAVLNQLDDADLARLGAKLEAVFDQYHLPIHIVVPGAPDGLGAAGGSREFSVDLVALTQELAREAKAWLSTEATLVFTQLQRVVAGVIGFVFKTFLVFMLTGFIAADTRGIMDFFYSMTPVSDRERLRDLLGRIDHGLSGVVRGQLTICVVNGVLTLIGLLLLDVKFAFLLGTLAAVFSLIPIFGSIISTIPIVVVALSNDVSTALLALSWILAIHALEANLLNPKILGDAAKIHPALVVLSLIVGEHYFGIVGALLAVPLMSILVTLFKSARSRAIELDGELSAEEASLEPDSAGTQPTAGPSARRRRVVREHAAP